MGRCAISAIRRRTEVPRHVTVIPDGLIRVARGGKMWTALVETKTGTGQLRSEQVEHYLDIARERGYDAVVTISNEIAPSAGVHPVPVDGRRLKKVSLHHLSWAEVLHEAPDGVAAPRPGRPTAGMGFE